MIENKVAGKFIVWVNRNIIAASLCPNAGGQLKVVEVYRESFAKRGEKSGELYALVDPRDWKIVGIISARSGEKDLLLMPLAEATGPHYLLFPIYRAICVH
jgi:hypothetical protein